MSYYNAAATVLSPSGNKYAYLFPDGAKGGYRVRKKK